MIETPKKLATDPLLCNLQVLGLDCSRAILEVFISMANNYGVISMDNIEASLVVEQAAIVATLDEACLQETSLRCLSTK